MSWCNNYSPPDSTLQEDDIYGPTPYDVNFCFPLALEALENERVKLTPFIPKLHASTLFDALKDKPEVFRHLLSTQFRTLRDVCVFAEVSFRRDPAFVLFAIFDKTRARSAGEEQKEAPMAGIIGMINSSRTHLSSELGYVVIFPDFQRTHILTHTAGLLLNYMLNLPSDPDSPGLGLRRVNWVAHQDNKRSVAAAERLGFRREGIHRWHWSLAPGKEGESPRKGDPAGEDRKGRYNVVLSMCWDDWESGGRSSLSKLMAREK